MITVMQSQQVKNTECKSTFTIRLVDRRFKLILSSSTSIFVVHLNKVSSQKVAKIVPFTNYNATCYSPQVQPDPDLSRTTYIPISVKGIIPNNNAYYDNQNTLNCKRH